MECIFCKTTPYRKKEYQIITRFIHNASTGNTESFVEKYNSYPEGEENIHRIYCVAQKLKYVYGEMFSPVALKNGKLISEFYNNANSLASELVKSIQKNALHEIKTLLTLWKNIICGNNNLCAFYPTPEFKFFFGTDGEKFAGKSATIISNFDCSSENILFLEKNKNIRVIDYEWTFEFPIPVDFIIYYNFSLFCKTHGGKSLLSEWLQNMNIDFKDCSSYDDMIAHFYDVVSVEGEIDYRQMGMYFLQPRYNDAFKQIEYKYQFPVRLIPAGKRVVIYGLGDVGRDYLNYLCTSSDYELAGCIDRNAESLRKQYNDVVKPENVSELCFDCIVLAICNRSVALQMQNTLLQFGVDGSKIIWDEEGLL